MSSVGRKVARALSVGEQLGTYNEQRRSSSDLSGCPSCPASPDGLRYSFLIQKESPLAGVPDHVNPSQMGSKRWCNSG